MKTLILFCISIFFYNTLFSQNVGIGTTAPKTNLHIAEDHSVLFGKDTIGSGAKMMWLPDLGAFRVGSLSGFINKSAWDRDNIGQYSFASGKNTKATGEGSTSMGAYTNAIGNFSTAMGFSTKASGILSTAMGYVTEATGEGSTSMGYTTRAYGESSTSMGRSTRAYGESSTAMGNGTQAQSYISTAIGSYNIGGGNSTTNWVDDDPIFEIGIGQTDGTRNNALTVLKDGRHGILTNEPKTSLHVAEDNRVLFGKDTILGGAKLMWLPDLSAFRVGTVDGLFVNHWDSDLFIGKFSFASGRNTKASGRNSTAIGSFSNANGDNSTAIGSNVMANGFRSIAMGSYTKASGENSTAMGRFTQAQSINSTAIGSNNIGGGDPVIWVDDDPILEVGIGQAPNNRNNALTILKNGRHGLMTYAPKANLHVKDDGTLGSGTIVAVLESSVSARPVLQFAENPNGDATSGMSIEYNGEGSGSNNKMHINDITGSPIVTFESGGQVGLGITSPTFALQLPNSSSTGVARAHSWTTYSDERIKSEQNTLNYGLREIMLLKPLSYKQHDASFVNSELQVSSESENTIGFFAQEVHEIIPEAAIKPENEDEQLWGMEYEKLIPVLVKAIQEQQYEIELLKAKLDAQEVKYISVQNYSEASLKEEK